MKNWKPNRFRSQRSHSQGDFSSKLTTWSQRETTPSFKSGEHISMDRPTKGTSRWHEDQIVCLKCPASVSGSTSREMVWWTVMLLFILRVQNVGNSTKTSFASISSTVSSALPQLYGQRVIERLSNCCEIHNPISKAYNSYQSYFPGSRIRSGLRIPPHLFHSQFNVLAQLLHFL